MIVPLTGQQYSEKVCENCVTIWKEMGIYTGAEDEALKKFKEALESETFLPGSSILFTHSPAGSLTVSSRANQLCSSRLDSWLLVFKDCILKGWIDYRSCSSRDWQRSADACSAGVDHWREWGLARGQAEPGAAVVGAYGKSFGCAGEDSASAAGWRDCACMIEGVFVFAYLLNLNKKLNKDEEGSWDMIKFGGINRTSLTQSK